MSLAYQIFFICLFLVLYSLSYKNVLLSTSFCSSPKGDYESHEVLKFVVSPELSSFFLKTELPTLFLSAQKQGTHLSPLLYEEEESYPYRLFKDKLRYIKNDKVYLSKNLFELGNTQLEVVRNTPQTGARGKTFYREEAEAKQGNYLISYSLSSCIN